jgi:hypothetical protein
MASMDEQLQHIKQQADGWVARAKRLEVVVREEAEAKRAAEAEAERLRHSLQTERELNRMHVEHNHDLEDKVERLSVLLAWEAGELSEGQAARALNTDRVTLRGYRQDEISLARRG